MIDSFVQQFSAATLQALTPAAWDSLIKTLDVRLKSVEDKKADFDAVVKQLQEIGLARINEALLPAFQEIAGLTQLGALFTAQSTTTVAIGTGAHQFTIALAGRDRFAPTAYLLIRSDSQPAAAMLGELVSYDRPTGTLTVTVDQVSGAGSHSDWTITPSPAPNLGHDARTDNPHQVTAAQVGAYTQAQIDALLTAVASDLGNRLRFDAAQALTAPQKTQAATNLGLGGAATKALATTAELRANTNANVITTDKAWDASKWQSLGNISGSVTIDASTGCRFYGTLTGNVTIDVSNLKDGQPLEIILVQDATGSRTVGWASKFKWPGAQVPGVTTNANTIAVVASCEGTWDASIVIGAGWKVT
jgi:hypothetical protein